MIRTFITSSFFVVGLALAGCASETADDEPVTEQQADELRDVHECTVSETVTAEVEAPIEDVYDYVARRDTPARDLRPYLLVPGVRGDKLLTPGGWDHSGARRIVLLDDGARCVEQLDELERPSHFSYHSNDYSFPLGLMIGEARGSWTFGTTAQSTTSVSWTYTFTPRSCMSKLELRVFAQKMFKPYMERAMTSITRHIEEGTP
jgi:hypothetical protein